MYQAEVDQLKALLDYDPETGVFRWKVSRGYNAPLGSVAGSAGWNGYTVIKSRGRQYKAHRLAWLFTHGSWPSIQLDHINGLRHDNRLDNLREATPAENCQNTAKYKSNTSGHMGRSFRKSSGRWQARISAKGKSLHLGFHTSPETAHAAYLAAKKVMHTFQPVPRGQPNG